MYEKLTKCPNFIWFLPEKLTKFPNFTWFLPENARIFHKNWPKIFFPRFFFGGRGHVGTGHAYGASWFGGRLSPSHHTVTVSISPIVTVRCPVAVRLLGPLVQIPGTACCCYTFEDWTFPEFSEQADAIRSLSLTTDNRFYFDRHWKWCDSKQCDDISLRDAASSDLMLSHIFLVSWRTLHGIKQTI